MNYKDFSYKMDYYTYLGEKHQFSHDGNVHKVYELPFRYCGIEIKTVENNGWKTIEFKKWFKPDIEFIVRVPKGFFPSAFYNKLSVFSSKVFE